MSPLKRRNCRNRRKKVLCGEKENSISVDEVCVSKLLDELHMSHNLYSDPALPFKCYNRIKFQNKKYKILKKIFDILTQRNNSGF